MATPLGTGQFYAVLNRALNSRGQKKGAVSSAGFLLLAVEVFRYHAASWAFATGPVFAQPCGFLRFCAAGRTSWTISGISNPIFSSMISVKAISARPRFPVLLKNGLAPAFNCRTRRETKFIRTCGFSTFSDACLMRSAFMYYNLSWSEVSHFGRMPANTLYAKRQ
jgi:hypothetical protein